MSNKVQVVQAKILAVEYVQSNKEFSVLQEKINDPSVSPEYKKQREQELSNLGQNKRYIEIIFQKEFGINLQELDAKTPLAIMNHVRNQTQQQQQTLQNTSPTRPLEIEKAPPQSVRAPVDTYKIEVERHGEPKKEPEPSQPSQVNTFTVTQPKNLAESLREAEQRIEQQKAQKPVHHERPDQQPRKFQDYFREAEERQRQRQQPDKGQDHGHGRD